MIGTANKNFSTSFKQTGHRLGAAKGFTFHSNRLATWAGATKGFITSFNWADLSGLVQPTDSSLPRHAGLFDLAQLTTSSSISLIKQAGLLDWHSQKIHFFIQWGLPFGSGSQYINSIIPCSGGFHLPKGHSLPVQQSTVWHRRLNSSFQLYSWPMRPFPNHSSLRGRSQFTAWPMRPILNHNCRRAGAF